VKSKQFAWKRIEGEQKDCEKKVQPILAARFVHEQESQGKNATQEGGKKKTLVTKNMRQKGLPRRTADEGKKNGDIKKPLRFRCSRREVALPRKGESYDSASFLVGREVQRESRTGTREEMQRE